ncbi:MAG: response regulator transcription factor [Rhodospirillaceae bacterium]
MKPAKRILLVDDATPLRQSLADQLRESGGFEVEDVETGAGALARVGVAGYDAIVIEAGLADMDGGELVRRLREEGERCPLILLAPAGGGSGPAGESDGLDIVAKPFRIGVLFALLRNRLREAGRDQDAVFVIGPYRFRPAAKLLLDEAADRTIRLTEKETAILSFLYRVGPTVTGRDVLLGEVWGYHAGIDTHTLETHVYRLRRKIEPDPANARILITEPGGYRLVP